MFIRTVRAWRLKLFLMLALSAALVTALILCIPVQAVTAVSASDGSKVYTGVKDNEDRVEFLRRFGWEVEGEPSETVNVTVPEVFDEIFEGYNKLQNEQGLDLSRYRRKTVTRYTYTVTNYPHYDGVVYATLLVYRGRVIGGDVCSAEADGFIHGFNYPTETGAN